MPADLNTIAAEWERFKQILPAGASEVQRVETRRAFFAGAASMFKLSMDAADLSDDAAEAMFECFDAELRNFAATLGTAQEGR